MEEMFNWFSQIDVSTVFVIVISGIVLHWVITFVVSTAIKRGIQLESKRIKKRNRAETDQRIETLCSAIRKTSRLLFFIIIVVMVLAELSVNITPLLTGAGVAGIAIGFGAQTLVKDFLSGIFLLVEDQFDIGDTITVAGVTGTVQEINLRRTILRDIKGVEYTIPNNEISVVENYTKDWSGMLINFAVPYSTDTAQVLRTARQVVKNFARLKHNRELLTEDPEVIGIVDYTTTGMILQIQGKTKPDMHWGAERELRQKLHSAFKKEKITMGASRLKL